MARREYTIYKVYVVVCSECNESITERSGEPTTRAEAERVRIDHENQHRSDEGRKLLKGRQ
jgi:hypothetical protein